MDNICDLLRNSKSIAVVGISDKPGRDSGWIAIYLKEQGFNVYGVNPNLNLSTFDGIPIYKSLKDIPEPVDIVDIFRRSEFVIEIVNEAIEINAKIIWMQLGVMNFEAEKVATNAGLKVVSNRCIYVEHRRCFG